MNKLTGHGRDAEHGTPDLFFLSSLDKKQSLLKQKSSAKFKERQHNILCNSTMKESKNNIHMQIAEDADYMVWHAISSVL